MKLHTPLMAIATGLFLAVQSASAQVSQEQLRKLQEQQLRILMLLQQQAGGTGVGLPLQAQQGIAPTTPVQAISEADMAKQIEALGQSQGGISVERYRDGFSIDGVRYVDPEGQLERYAYDALVGDITYLVQTMPMQYKIKTMRARTGREPVTIATATQNAGQWQVQTVTGKALSGTRLIPLSRGVLVARDNVAFKYIPGQGVTNIVGPEEFHIASFQNGDIEGTGYILMERIPESGGSAGDIINSVKALGSVLGVNRKDDYLLLHMATGKTIPINVPQDGKMVMAYSQCRKKNAVLNICDRMDSFESLYDTMGRPNLSHYFWRISWYKTSDGPILISQEGGLKEIVATNLDTGKKITLFRRALGIAGFNTKQDADGKISVIAQMGFSRESIEDVVAYMNKPIHPQQQTTSLNAGPDESKEKSQGGGFLDDLI